MKDTIIKGFIEKNNKNQSVNVSLKDKFNRFKMFESFPDPKSYRNKSFVNNLFDDIFSIVSDRDNLVLLITTVLGALVLLNLSKYLWVHSSTGFVVLMAILFIYIFFVYMDLLLENTIMAAVFLPIYMIFLTVAVHPKVVWLLAAILLWLIIFRSIVVYFSKKYSKGIVRINEEIELNDNKIIKNIREKVMSTVSIRGIVDIDSIKKDGLEYIDDRYIKMVLNEAVENGLLEEFVILVKDKNKNLYKTNNITVSQVMEID